ncbi:unnamed protein product [Urochloa humidicola]
MRTTTASAAAGARDPAGWTSNNAIGSRQPVKTEDHSSNQRWSTAQAARATPTGCSATGRTRCEIHRSPLLTVVGGRRPGMPPPRPREAAGRGCHRRARPDPRRQVAERHRALRCEVPHHHPATSATPRPPRAPGALDRGGKREER